jgi:hypothetical protein
LKAIKLRARRKHVTIKEFTILFGGYSGLESINSELYYMKYENGN